MPAPFDVLLINPWIYDFTAYDFWAKPLGLLQVSAFLKDHTKCRVSFIDCLDRSFPRLPQSPCLKPDGRGPYHKEEVPKPEVLRGVPRKYSRYGIPVQLFVDELGRVFPPDLVMVTCTMTYWYPGVQAVVDLVRKRFGAVPIVLGGIYASLLPDHARRESGADFVCTGRAEKNLPPVLRGIFGEKAVFSGSGEYASPRPDYSLLRDRSSLPVVTSRGCPYACSFCATPLLHPRFFQDSPGSVVDLIGTLARKYKTHHIAFYDDALLVNKKKHIVPILEGILQKGLRLSFHTPNGLHVGEIDFELAALLKKANFVSLYLSQESFDKNLIEESCPKVGEKDLENALIHLEKAGYSRKEVNVYLIVGLCDQEAAAVREAVLRVKQLGARPRLAYFSPIPETPEWRKAADRGHLEDGVDPLLHNKLTFPYLWGRFSPEEFGSIGELLR